MGAELLLLLLLVTESGIGSAAAGIEAEIKVEREFEPESERGAEIGAEIVLSMAKWMMAGPNVVVVAVERLGSKVGTRVDSISEDDDDMMGTGIHEMGAVRLVAD